MPASNTGENTIENLQTKTAKTTALNHCFDCNYLKQSRRLTKHQLEGGGSQILFVAYQINERAQVLLHSHSCESLEYRTLLFGFESNCNGYQRDVNLFEGGISRMKTRFALNWSLTLPRQAYLPLA
jgi:hypothetical protein